MKIPKTRVELCDQKQTNRTSATIHPPIAPDPPTAAPPTSRGMPTGEPTPLRVRPSPAVTARPPAMQAEREPTCTLEPRNSTESSRVAMSRRVATVIQRHAREADRLDLKFGSRLKQKHTNGFNFITRGTVGGAAITSKAKSCSFPILIH